VNDQDWRAERFETSRPQLRVVAYRMLGSLSEADDAVQEAWLRLSRSDVGGIESLSAWLTTDSLRGRSRVAHAPISYSARVTSHVPGLKQCGVEINASPDALYLDQRGPLIAVGEISGRQIASTNTIVNPETLAHLGPVGDLASLLRPTR
jgi:Sigma-70 region 2